MIWTWGRYFLYVFLRVFWRVLRKTYILSPLFEHRVVTFFICDLNIGWLLYICVCTYLILGRKHVQNWSKIGQKSMKIEAWGVSGACFWSLGCCWRVLWMLGVDFDGFRGHFGLHFESNFGPEMCYCSSYFLIGCWMWFWAVFDQFSGRFWCALEQKCGLPWNMWDCEKLMFYVMNSMISKVRDGFVDPKTVEKHTWNLTWVLKLLFVGFLKFWAHFRIILGPNIDIKSIWILNGFGFLF